MFILGVTFAEFIKRGNVILGIVLAIIGLAMYILAGSIAKAVRKGEEVKPDDKVLVGIKVAGLIVLMVGMILIALPV